jgi:TonB family protein
MTQAMDRNLLAGFAIAVALAGCLLAFVRSLPIHLLDGPLPAATQPRPRAAWTTERDIDWRPRAAAKAPESAEVPAAAAAPYASAPRVSAPAPAVKRVANGAVAVPAVASKADSAAPGELVPSGASAGGAVISVAKAGGAAADASTAVYGPGDVDVPPQAQFAPQPRYPAEAQRLGLTAEVILTLVIEADGQVSHVEVRCNACDPAFLRVTRETARTWRFAPARLHGAPVRVRVEQRFPFVLDDD